MNSEDEDARPLPNLTDVIDPNTLYFGDNLTVMRTFADETVDLCYIDPPFNRSRNHFVLFKDRTGKASAAQQEAFDDTWTWNEESEATYRGSWQAPAAPLGQSRRGIGLGLNVGNVGVVFQGQPADGTEFYGPEVIRFLLMVDTFAFESIGVTAGS